MGWAHWLQSRIPYRWHQVRRWSVWHRPLEWVHRIRGVVTGWLFWRPRLRRFGIAVAVLAFLFVVSDRIGYWVWWGSYGLDSVPVLGVDFAAGYADWHDQRLRPLFVDRDDRVIGLYPIVGTSSDYAGDYSGDTYMAAAPQTVPEPWWRMVRLIEDGNRDAWYHINGIDLSQFVKIPYRTLVKGARIRGGSTLEMQLSKVMQRDTDVTGISLLLRKARDLLHAPMLSYFFERDPRHSLKDWYATHVPLLYHGDEQGLAAASHLLFNRAPAELSLAQQALLAAAVKNHLGLTHAVNWDQAKERGELALTQLHEAGGLSTEAFEEARHELRSMAFTGTPAPEPAVWSACTGQPQEEAQSPTQLQGRAAELALPVLLQASTELKEVRGANWWSGLERVALTLDLAQNCRTTRRIEATRERVFPQISTTLASRDEQGRVYGTLAVADRAGRIVRFYSDLSLPYYHGYGWEGGRLVLKDEWQEPRQIGSVGKVLASVVAGMEGDTPETEYFVARRYKRIGPYPNRPTLPFQNFDGSIGYEERSESGAMITARQAFARSNNLAVMQRLDEAQPGQEQLVQLVRDFGLTPPSIERATRVGQNLVVDIPMGNIRGSPRMVHRMMRAVGTGIAADGRGACAPHLVAGVWPTGRADEGPLAWSELMPASRVCERAREHYLANPEARDFVRTVLGGVVDCNYRRSSPMPCSEAASRLHGTAASALGRWSADRRPDDVRWHIAKTGTTSVQAERLRQEPVGTRTAAVTGVVALDGGQRYSYVTQVGARRSQGNGLGATVYGGDVAVLMRPVLADLIDKRTNEPATGVDSEGGNDG